MDCIYLNLKKAFDKVPHRRLLWKLELHLMIKRNIEKWMEYYLKRKEMITVVKDGKIRVEGNEKWSTTGISFATNNVFSICK